MSEISEMSEMTRQTPGETPGQTTTQPTEPTAPGAQAAAGAAPDFATLYRQLLRAAFVDIVRDDVAAGADPAAQARAYAERGKPDFVLAYLLISPLDDDEKRDLYAQAHDRRAVFIEQRAKEFDRSFHRPFPLLGAEAAKDRALARQIRAGRSVKPGAGRRLPMR